MTRKILALTAAAMLAALLAIPGLSVLAANPGPRVLITQPVNNAQTVTLYGNTRPEANARFDRGRVADTLPLNHMLLQLKRAPEMESAFEAYIDLLTDKSSPNFRHWLTAAEQGEQFGVAQQDIDAVSAWLESQGFSVNHVYPNHMVIDFSGTAGQIRNAFHTEIHNLQVGREEHIANMSDPQVPAALAPAIHGVVSMHNFRPEAYHKFKTDYTFAGCGTNCYALVPEDFQTIYNLAPLYTAGITGKGQTVAVVEDTNTFGTDWATYRSKFKLATYGGTLTTTHPNSAGNCTNPGTNPDDVEANLDVQMVTAAAPGAAVEVISCSDTTTTFGGLIAIQNIISAGSPPPIITMSYGLCEVVNGAAANAAFNSAFQSAAAAGVSVFTSSGDNGPSTCARLFTNGDSWAYPGIGITGWGESQYTVSVGGTDFEDLYIALSGGAPQSTYWKSSNDANFGSAKSYIPEIPWNDSCASYLVYNIEGYASPVGTTGFCNSTTGANFLSTVAGGGGPSGCYTGVGNQNLAYVENTTCAGYPKPAFQKGVFGNPGDGVRDVPDVALFGSNGIWGHYIIICYSDAPNGGVPCTGAPSGWVGIGGTSASAPLMAGIQALVNQHWSIRAGNPNPIYYSIAKTQFGTKGDPACYSINETAGNACVFNDITQGDIDVNCQFNASVFKADCYRPSGTNGAISTQKISSLALKKGGSGFTTTPSCVISVPNNKTKYASPTGTTIFAGGTQAKCTAAMSGGVVTTVTLTNAGSGYTGVPKCTISGGGGKGATCTATITPTVSANSYQPAFGATPGWDMATGLGSVNGFNLVMNSAW
ncbi:MAG TPA: protease pro-enzyme activation domain-containing protein [Candidatus Binatia bacterium]|nr:protease pro-enzyme activation domain-containing protein [Candidatus Binatia bacterium]